MCVLSKKHKNRVKMNQFGSGNAANLLLRIARKSENIDGESYYYAIKSLANFSQELDSSHHHSSSLSSSFSNSHHHHHDSLLFGALFPPNRTFDPRNAHMKPDKAAVVPDTSGNAPSLYRDADTHVSPTQRARHAAVHTL